MLRLRYPSASGWLPVVVVPSRLVLAGDGASVFSDSKAHQGKLSGKTICQRCPALRHQAEVKATL